MFDLFTPEVDTSRRQRSILVVCEALQDYLVLNEMLHVSLFLSLNFSLLICLPITFIA